jgi:hypothetical protein
MENKMILGKYHNLLKKSRKIVHQDLHSLPKARKLMRIGEQEIKQRNMQ